MPAQSPAMPPPMIATDFASREFPVPLMRCPFLRWGKPIGAAHVGQRHRVDARVPPAVSPVVFMPARLTCRTLRGTDLLAEEPGREGDRDGQASRCHRPH